MDRVSLVFALAPCLVSLGCTEGRSGQRTADGATGVDEGDDDAEGDDGVEAGGRLDAMQGGDASDAADSGVEEGCGAIDFVFVIDNSGSMLDNQQNLVDSFPGFIDAISGTLDEAEDYHVMVVKTDEPWVAACDLSCGILGQCAHIPSWNCAGEPTAECDETLGAGVSNPLGQDSSSRDCMLADGHRYITPAEPDLSAAFECVASVGTSGAIDERPIDALLAALTPDINGPGGCNEGFLRDEAILVVTIITDEEDHAAVGTPQQWAQQVKDIKAGAGKDGSGVVMIGLINDTDAASPVCDDISQDPTRLREFVESFPHSFRGSVCADDYATVLADAVSIIDTTCDEYVPPAG